MPKGFVKLGKKNAQGTVVRVESIQDGAQKIVGADSAAE